MVCQCIFINELSLNKCTHLDFHIAYKNIKWTFHLIYYIIFHAVGIFPLKMLLAFLWLSTVTDEPHLFINHSDAPEQEKQ